MKKFSNILLLSFCFVLLMSASAFANVPRWPEPAWFAQFHSSPTRTTQPTPQPVPQPAPPGSGQVTAPQTSTLTSAELYIFNAVNRERTTRGLAPLKINPTLVQLARQKSLDMIENNYFAHRSPVLGSAYDMMRKAGVRYNFAGENLSRTGSAASAMNLLMNSSIHRRTLLSSRFSETGIGVVQLGRQLYVTQMFIGFLR